MRSQAIILVIIRGDYFQFDSIFIKKNNQTGFLKKTGTGSNRPVQFGLVI
jgi:hypothetical protein